MVWSTPLQNSVRSLFGQQRCRFLHSSGVRCDSPNTSSKAGKEVGRANQPPPQPESRFPGGPIGIPTALDKKFLVWSGMYKSADQIPKQMEGDIIHRARSWGRIRINIGFLFLTAIGGGVMVYLGKSAAARGESIEQQNLDWHKQVRDDYEKSKK